MTFLKRNLEYLMAEREFTQEDVAQRLEQRGVKTHQSTVSRVLSGQTKSPGMAVVNGLAAVFGVDVNELINADLSKRATTAREPLRAYNYPLDVEEFIPIRRVDFRVSAGVSGFALDYLDGDAPRIAFRADWLALHGLDPAKLFAVTVSGRSMEPGLFEGDTVVIDTADTNAVDGRAMAANFDGEFVLKRLKRNAGQWWLASDNPDKSRYPDKLCDERVTLVGRAIYRSSEIV